MAKAKEPVLLEVAAGGSLGSFKVGGRSFDAKPLLVKEGRDLNAAYKDGQGNPRSPLDEELSEPLAQILNARAQDKEPVTPEWLEDNASGSQYFEIITLLQNPKAYATKKDNDESEEDSKN